MNFALALCALVATAVQMMLDMGELGREHAMPLTEGFVEHKQVRDAGLVGRAARRERRRLRRGRPAGVKRAIRRTWLSLLSWSALTFVALQVAIAQWPW